MRGHRPALRTPRVRARGAAIAAFVALAPLISSAAAAVGSREVTAKLPYDCALPSGQQRVAVRVKATFPGRATTGEAIRPTAVSTTVELPAPAIADLAALKATTVVPETRLSLEVAQHGAKTQALWRGTGAAQPVAVPAEGPLTLTTTGDAPTVTAVADGDLTLTATDLAVDLALGTADGAPTTPASLAPATPASLTLDCTLAKDAAGHGLLATVPVGPTAHTPAPSGSPSPSGPTAPASGRPKDPAPSTGPGTPKGSTAPGGPAAPTPGDKGEDKDKGKAPKVGDARSGPAAVRPPAPRCVKENPTSQSLTGYITGYSNVSKLGGASLIPLSCVQIEQGPADFVPFPDGTFHIIQNSEGNLDHQGRKQTPPFTSTFLTFGFTPTTATMVLEQAGPMSVAADVLLDFSTGNNYATTYVRVPLVLRVLDVKVNGTRLDVGPSCRTAGPLSSPEPDPGAHPGPHLVMLGKGVIISGEPATGYQLSSGGPLTGEVTVPAFTGCGAGGEDLDRLLTASISGSGNYIKQMQGQTCSVAQPTEGECTEDLQPYVVPKPER
ncbi:DUF6801 domain-containing protein [Streptomyces sp. NPDC099050]|uniref:DUF6801 domain-containing protein n=1 Tax=Streptomyces sp. NPDC099050 TaxID=3366100 RepID=UPI003818C066